MKSLNIILAAALLGTSLSAIALDDKNHSKKTAGSVKKEQKDWGIAGDAKSVTRTIQLTMSDTMRFTPDRIEVRQGEVVKFVVKNAGKTLHEMVIGDKKTLDEHAALMMKFPNMAHDEPYMTHVAAGKASQLIWNFNRAGDFDFACLIAGHYQAGMAGKIKVVADGKASASAAPSATAGFTQAQSTAPANGMTAAPQADLSDAEVRKIDKENKKVTLKHGEIKNLDMPAMTMIFEVSDAAVLDKLTVGDKIRFRAVAGGNKLMANDIQPARR